LIFFIFLIATIANAESWIKLNLPKGYINYIDRDSIKKEGDFAYYKMKDDSENYSLLKFRHDCKYKARQIIAKSKYNSMSGKLTIVNNFYSEVVQYPRSEAMVKVETIVCKT
jgi:hypothetical protein